MRVGRGFAPVHTAWKRQIEGPDQALGPALHSSPASSQALGAGVCVWVGQVCGTPCADARWNSSKNLLITPWIMDPLVCAPGGMAAAFKPGSEEWPSLWPFDEFVSAWQGLAAARALVSPPFQEAQPCQRLFVTLFVPGSPWRPLRNTFYLLGLAGTLCPQGLLPGLPSGFGIVAHGQGTPGSSLIGCSVFI